MRRPFISYAREDYEIALRIHDDLRRAGLVPWLDRKNIRAGEDWRMAIRAALKSATHVIALISQHSVNKRGYVQHELRQALELLEEVPPDQIYIIPVRLDRSLPNHDRLNDLNRVDLFDGYEVGLLQILEALRATSKSSITPITEPDINQVAAMIVHEVNNSIGFFGVYLDIIRREAGQLEHVAQSVDVLGSAVASVLKFTQSVTTLVRPQRITARPVKVSEWFAAIRPELLAIVGDRVQLDIREDQPGLVIAGQQDSLTHVVTNLVKNAAEAIKGDGQIVIAAERASLPGGEQAVCLSIADTGSGIDPQHIDHIFKPFYTTKAHGTGVGLPLAQKIVSAHGGTLEVQSKLRNGSTFFVYLPMAIGSGDSAEVS